MQHRADALGETTPMSNLWCVWRAAGACLSHVRASAATPAVKRRRVVWVFQVIAKTLRFPMVVDGNCCSTVLNSHYWCDAMTALSGTDVRRRAATLGAQKTLLMAGCMPGPCVRLQTSAEGRLTRAPATSVPTVIPQPDPSKKQWNDNIFAVIIDHCKSICFPLVFHGFSLD